MLELNLPCPMCGNLLVVPDAPCAFQCRACGEQLRTFDSDAVRGIQRLAGPDLAYAGAVRYVVVRGNPEEHRNWEARFSELSRERAGFRRSRNRWYLVTALITLLGVAAVVLVFVGGSIGSRQVAGTAGLAAVAALILVILTAAVGSHYQRLEMRASEYMDAWRMREPLNHGEPTENRS